ncbi:uncharacterized protein [Henckelia pumila]|uniref:uncharacterized protein n=1 Tax=Henckelia pumila TaxID=405737 RepID=UPI003C6E7146
MADEVDNHTVLDLIRPPVARYGSSIVRPTVEANSFELKPSIIQMIHFQARFGGTFQEDPYAHLEHFLSICDIFKFNGVTSDAVRLRLCPFSLQGDALEWLDDLPTGNQGQQSYNSYNNTYNQNWQSQPKKEVQKPSFEEIMMMYVAGTEARLQSQEHMLQKLETQMAHIATQLSTRPTGAFPSNTEPNPKGVNAIMVVTRSQSENPEQQRDEETSMEGPKRSEVKKDARAENCSTVGRKDALAHMPNYSRFLKDLLRNKKKLNDVPQVTINEECSAVLKIKLPTKSQDPRRFSIPCQIGNLSLKNILCDLGSSINLMPYSLAQKLGIENIEPTSIPLKFVDGSVKYPRGVVENILVKIDKFFYLVDFVILDMNEDCEVPLILGRPFLAASRALVDVENEELVLRLNNEQVVFTMIKSDSDSSNLKSCSDVNFIDVIHDVGECQQIQFSVGICPLQNLYSGEACSCRIDLSFFKMMDKPP